MAQNRNGCDDKCTLQINARKLCKTIDKFTWRYYDNIVKLTWQKTQSILGLIRRISWRNAK